MSGTNTQITGDNLPRDSGNRYFAAPYEPSGNRFLPQLGYPVSGSAIGAAVGHVIHNIIDTFSATATVSSGVDLGGFTIRGLMAPAMGSGCNFMFQVSASAQAYATVSNTAGVAYSASGLLQTAYALDQTVIQHVNPYRFVRMSATVMQTAARNFTWQVAS